MRHDYFSTTFCVKMQYRTCYHIILQIIQICDKGYKYVNEITKISFMARLIQSSCILFNNTLEVLFLCNTYKVLVRYSENVVATCVLSTEALGRRRYWGDAVEVIPQAREECTAQCYNSTEL